MKTVKIFVNGELHSTVETDSVEYVRNNVMSMFGDSGKIIVA